MKSVASGVVFALIICLAPFGTLWWLEAILVTRETKSNILGDYQGVVVEAIEQEEKMVPWPDGSGRFTHRQVTYWSLVKIDDGRKVLVLGQREVGEKLLVREYADSGFSPIRH